jgi:phage terminase large subunit-like protein
VGCTVDNGHHLVRLGLWEAPPDRPDWRVPVEDVEQAVRELCRTFEVIEITADPYRWTRSLQILAGEGLPVSEFPQSGARMTPATTSLSEAFTNETVTHPADDKMREHFLNAVMREDYRGTRVQKDSKMSNRRIDLCVASLMAHARATWYHAQPIKKGRAFAW